VTASFVRWTEGRFLLPHLPTMLRSFLSGPAFPIPPVIDRSPLLIGRGNAIFVARSDPSLSLPSLIELSLFPPLFRFPFLVAQCRNCSLYLPLQSKEKPFFFFFLLLLVASPSSNLLGSPIPMYVLPSLFDLVAEMAVFCKGD